MPMNALKLIIGFRMEQGAVGVREKHSKEHFAQQNPFVSHPDHRNSTLMVITTLIENFKYENKCNLIE